MDTRGSITQFGPVKLVKKVVPDLTGSITQDANPEGVNQYSGAASEAAKATTKAGERGVKADKSDSKGDHQNAAASHARASLAHQRAGKLAGNNSDREYHEKMSNMHDKEADYHGKMGAK